MKYFVAALIVVCSVSVKAQTVVHGKITDGNGHAALVGQAHFGNSGEKASKSKTYTASADGSYSFTVDKPGMYELRFSAVDHEEATVPLFVQKGDKNIELDARLKPNPFDGEYDRVTIIGDWNKFEFSGSDTMTPVMQNGRTVYTFTRQATGDTLSYQLLGVAGSHSVNGTDADYYTYDGGGDYRAVKHTKAGQNVTITFDPSKWNYAPNEDLPEITVKNDPFLEKAVALSMKADEMYEEAQASTEHTQHGGSATISSEKYKDMVDYLRKTIEDANAKGDKQFAEYAAVTLASKYVPGLSSEPMLVLKTVPATSQFWGMNPMYANYMLGLADSNFASKYRHQMEKNPERVVQAYAYADEMANAFDHKDDKTGNKLYAKLKKDYSDVSQIKYQMTAYDPDAPTRVGKHVPAFEVALLNSTDKVSDKTMMGRYYMIDFWATWCGPCVREMPSLHKAYEKFKGRKGFEIVSLSMDGDQSPIAPFRKKWAMPWMNAYIPGVWDAALAKEFEIAFIPNPILVGPDGTILARQDDLRGDLLEKTLEKYLGEAD